MATQLNKRHAPRHPARLQERYDRMVRVAGARGRFIRSLAGPRF